MSAPSPRRCAAAPRQVPARPPEGSPTSAEGALRLRLRLREGRIAASILESTRPHAARIFAGRSPAEVLTAVPVLYSICARAQGAAAQAALAAARARSFDAAAARTQVLAEALHETLWRIALDWPALLGEPPRPAPFAALRRELQALMRGAPHTDGLAERLARYLADEVFGLPVETWLAMRDWAALSDWAERGACVAARLLARVECRPDEAMHLLPALDAAQVHERLLPALIGDEAFWRRPEWDGAPAETGALARWIDHPLVDAARRAAGATAARLAARLVEAAALAHALERPGALAWVRAQAPARGQGCGVVETARGVLVHYARLDAAGERVVDYRILAPTEWNFHPQGALAHALAGRRAADADAARALACLEVAALDPCVACSVEIEHA